MRKNKFFIYLLVVFFSFLFLFQTIGSTLSDSPTNDEQVHLLAGLSYITFADLRVNPEHPPLVKLLSAIGVKLFYPNFSYPYSAEQFADQMQWLQPIADKMFAQNDATKLLLSGRLPLILLTLIFAISLFLFLKKNVGMLSALVGFTLLLFEPNILGYGKLIITDNIVAGFLFFSSLFLYKYLDKGENKFLCFFTLSFLASLLSKYTALFFIPLFLIASIFYLILEGQKVKVLIRFTVKYMVSLLVCFAGIWAVYSLFAQPKYFFHKEPQMATLYEKVQPQWPIRLIRSSPLPYYYSYGISYVYAQGYFGQKTYLFGKWGNINWWWFYPVTFLLKTPLLFILFFTISPFFVVKTYRKLALFLWFLFFSYLLITSLSPLAIGMRVILPLTYLSIPTIALTVPKLEKLKMGRLLLTLYITIIIVIRLFSYPHYISHINILKLFFNSYNMMVDTNFDWGQDIKRLALYFKEKGIQNIYFSSDAAVKPQLYGLQVTKIPYDFEKPKPKGWLALSISARNFPVSVTDKLGRQGGYDHPYSWLDQYPVYHVIGNTLLIYFIP